MSHSPENPDGLRGAAEFMEAQRRLQQLLRSGMSLSGNERNCFYLNTGAAGEHRFADVSAVSGFDFLDDGRAAATADWDGDGDLDIWLVNRTGPQVRFVRNDAQTSNHFVQFKLVGDGKKCNRDAIGARVEVHLPDGTKLIDTVRAGEGYLSQSSKVLHFGLGQANRVERVVVRWPSGESQELSVPRIDRRYVVALGKEELDVVPPRPEVNLQPKPLPRTPPTTTSRTFFAARMPLPRIAYTNAAGERHRLREHVGSPLLINLWAPSCHPCLTELAHWAEEEDALKKAGLSVITLRVIGSDEDADRSADGQLERLSASFRSGAMDAQTAQLLETFLNALFYQSTHLAVPSTLLIDEQGRLAALYRGSVTVEQLTRDASLLDASDDKRFDLAIPFPGARYGEPSRLSPGRVALWLTERELFAEASDYIADHAGDYPSDRDFARANYNLGVWLQAEGEERGAVARYREAAQTDPNYAAAHYNMAVLLARIGELTAAESAYRDALRADPHDFKTLNNLALLLHDQGNTEAALPYYRKALEIVPDDLDSLNNLGNALVQMKRVEEALPLFRRCLRLQADARTYYNLGAALDAAAQYEEAIGAYRSCLKENDDHMLAHNNLGVDLARLKQFAEAEIHLRRAIELDPSYQPARNNLKLLNDLRGSD